MSLHEHFYLDSNITITLYSYNKGNGCIIYDVLTPFKNGYCFDFLDEAVDWLKVNVPEKYLAPLTQHDAKSSDGLEFAELLINEFGSKEYVNHNACTEDYMGSIFGI